MQSFKQGELHLARDTQALSQGSFSPHLYTILEGMVFRFLLLEDGRRQIVNFMFPGDLVGLQGAMDDPLTHGVEALTDVTLCIFSRDRLMELYREQARLGFDVTWLAAKEESALEGHLTSIGRRSAMERIAYLALFLIERANQSGLSRDMRLDVTITQAQIADMLGLSLVHTNRTMQALKRRKLIEWNQSGITILDRAAASLFAHFEPDTKIKRPFI